MSSPEALATPFHTIEDPEYFVRGEWRVGLATSRLAAGRNAGAPAVAIWLERVMDGVWRKQPVRDVTLYGADLDALERRIATVRELALAWRTQHPARTDPHRPRRPGAPPASWLAVTSITPTATEEP